MTQVENQESRQLLDRMVEAKQLSPMDAETLAQEVRQGSKATLQSEEEVLRWLAKEYDVAYTAPEDVEPDRQLLSLFPARILLKEQLLLLRRTNCTVQVATSRLFATQGLDALKAITALRRKRGLAPAGARHRFAREDSEQPEHRRQPAPARRPNQDSPRKQRGRHSRVPATDAPR